MCVRLDKFSELIAYGLLMSTCTNHEFMMNDTDHPYLDKASPASAVWKYRKFTMHMLICLPPETFTRQWNSQCTNLIMQIKHPKKGQETTYLWHQVVKKK